MAFRGQIVTNLETKYALDVRRAGMRIKEKEQSVRNLDKMIRDMEAKMNVVNEDYERTIREELDLRQ